MMRDTGHDSGDDAADNDFYELEEDGIIQDDSNNISGDDFICVACVDDDDKKMSSALSSFIN